MLEDSSEIPVYGEYNKHYESTCYHPLLLFNSAGDCVAAKLRPGAKYAIQIPANDCLTRDIEDF